MGRSVPGTSLRHEGRCPTQADQPAIYSSYDPSSFAWFVRGDGPDGIRRRVLENPAAPNPATTTRFQYPTGVAPKVLARSFFPAISQMSPYRSQLPSYSAA